MIAIYLYANIFYSTAFREQDRALATYFFHDSFPYCKVFVTQKTFRVLGVGIYTLRATA